MREFKSIILVVFFLLCCVTVVYTQDNKPDLSGMSAKSLKKFGKSADRQGDTYTALDLYQAYCKLRPGDVETGYRLAQLYFAARDYQKAEKQFQKVYKSDPESYPEALYFQAVSIKNQGRYMDAKEVYLKFGRKLKSSKKLTMSSSALKDEIQGCDLAISAIEKPLKVSVTRLGGSVNGPHQELSPVSLNTTQMLYSSLKSDGNMYYNQGDTSKLPVRQFYVAKLEGADWTGGQPFDDKINIPGVETGNGAFSRDGNRFYFTRGSHTLQGKYRCEIYMSQKDGKSWGEPKKLNALINDPNYTATQPAIGYSAKSDLEIIYFVSDREGGRGGFDIWYSLYDKRKEDFGDPKNAGSKINTAGDELTPFYDLVTRSLYFSSTGHSGLGGFDVYTVMGEMRKWLKPINVGYPINSSYDDLYFNISPNRENGFLVSNRPGGESFQNPTCCDDIYQYRWTEYIRVAVTGGIYPADAQKLGKNLDQAKLMAMRDKIKPMVGAILSLYMVDKETKEKVFVSRVITKEDGMYFFDLLPDRDYKFEMEGFQYFNEQVNFSTDGINITYTIEMPPIWVNVISDKPIVLKNVYYETDKSELTAQAKSAIDSTLVELMNKATDIIVEVSAHTDSVGNYSYNKKLSQDRADNVVKYLVGKGISKKRLVAKGYGPDKPIAPNFKPDKSDNPEGREKNRRSEFRVIGTLSSITEEIDVDENQ